LVASRRAAAFDAEEVSPVADGLHGSGDLPHPPKLKRKRYERELLALQWDGYTEAANPAIVAPPG
jgi:hypothetical protein